MPPKSKIASTAHELPVDYVPKSRLLSDRVILISGANGGLGRATALACAGLGATVVLLGRNMSKLEALYDQIEQAGGPQPAIYPMNLAGASWGDYGTLADKLDEAFGRLDAIVHAAAHFKAFTSLEQLPPKEWLESLQVNLTAPYALTAQCLPLLEKSADASVVFISDPSAQTPRAYFGAYGVAKYALEALLKTWSQELEFKPNLRFNSYDPGPMRTSLRRRGYPQEDMAQLNTPEIVVPALLWLLGPDSHGITGRSFSRNPHASDG